MRKFGIASGIGNNVLSILLGEITLGLSHEEAGPVNRCVLYVVLSLYVVLEVDK